MISVGNQIGRYKILNSIGVGGMGEVFLALDIELGRFVALKVLPSDLSHDKERIRRFVQEAKTVSALNHPNILTIYETGLVNGMHFIATEFIKGKTLRDTLKAEQLNLNEAVDIAIQITSALHAAHSSQIIHRDIKPENIMIRDDNLVKVLDFGLAKLFISPSRIFNSESPTCKQVKTKSGMVLGTIGYMSPEQARGKSVDPRTDIFSLGVVTYELLTGIQPFNGETNSDVIAAILMREPQNPRSLNSKIPVDLERIVLKTLFKDPNNRFQNAKDLLMEFEELKQELNFKSKIERRILANEQAEAKTDLFEADTDVTINVASESIEGQSINKNPFIRITKKVKLAYKFHRSIPVILSLMLISFLAYFILSTVWLPVPKKEAVKLFNNGSEALREGTYYKASKMLEDAVNIDNNFAQAHARLAEAWMELDYNGRAQNELLKVNELQRKRQTFLSSFFQTEDSIYLDAMNSTVMRNFPAAVKIYQKIVELNPTEPQNYLDLGRAFEKNEEIDEAIDCYEKAATLDAQYGAAFLRLGILRSRKAEYDKSNDAFDRAENIYDRLSNDEGVLEVRYQRGVSFNSQEKLGAARTQFENVINNPRASKYQQIRALLQISSACSSEGKTDCAEEFALKAITLAKEERMENIATNGLINLGNAFLARGEYDKAEQNFQQGLDFARKDEGFRNEARALLTLGSLRIQQKKPDEAQSFVNQALSFFQKGGYNKEVSQAILILGRASEMKEDYDAALQAFQQVENSETAPVADKAYAKMVSGNVLKHQEKYPEALRSLEQSYDLYQSLNNPFYTTYTLFYLSLILFQLGRFEEAKDKLFKAQAILKKGDSLYPQLSTETHLLNARIALSGRNFTEAIKEVKQDSLSKDPSIASDANMIIGLAQTSSNPKNPEGIKKCIEALENAVSTKDTRAINTTKLALAEAYLNTGNYSDALETALQAKNYFITAGQLDSGWRALVLAGKAKQQKGDGENARNYATNALEILHQLQSDWGQEQFDNYLSKPDNNLYFKQAQELSKS